MTFPYSYWFSIMTFYFFPDSLFNLVPSCQCHLFVPILLSSFFTMISMWGLHLQHVIEWIQWSSFLTRISAFHHSAPFSFLLHNWSASLRVPILLQIRNSFIMSEQNFIVLPYTKGASDDCWRGLSDVPFCISVYHRFLSAEVFCRSLLYDQETIAHR